MNYTENYHLPQWEETDRIMRVDFNQMCADMEAGLTANAEHTERVEEKADEIWYATGTYHGALHEVTVVTGFKPRLILFCKQHYEGNDSSLAYPPVVFFNPTANSKAVRLTDDGFVLLISYMDYPGLNRSGTQYFYIAFR